MSQTEQPTRTDAYEPSTPPERRSPWRTVGLVVLGIAIAVALLAVGLRLAHRGEVLPGVAVDGVDLGGLGRDDARAVLQDIVAGRRTDPVVLRHEDGEFTYRPGEAAYTAELDEAVDAAMAPGRSDDPLTDAWRHVSAVWRAPIEVTLTDAIDRRAIRSFIRDVGGEVNIQPSVGEVRADPETGRVTVERPHDGRIVRERATVDLVIEAIRSPGPDTVDLPMQTIEHLIDPDSVDEVASQMRRAVAGPTVLTVDDERVVFEARDVARLLSSQPEDAEGVGRRLMLTVEVDAVDEVFTDDIVDRLEREPRDATFELVSGLRTFDDKDDAAWTPTPAELEVVPGADGREFIAADVAEELSELYRAGRRSGALELAVLRPTVTTDEARSWNVDQLIGTFTTYHACCANRVHNIQRVADMVRGEVVEPGGVFSVNGITGERTTAKGFLADGVIKGGEFIQEVGGGVSQFATTAFNAAFFAGLEFEEYKAHSYYISRYPMGREATLYWPYLDLRWRNTTDNGIYVHTSYTGTSITVSLFGNNGGTTVRADLGEPFNWRTHETEYRYTSSLPKGSRRVVQSGGTGFDVVVMRHVDDREPQRFFTRYEAQLEIIEVGTRERSEPRQEPREEESPSPAPQESPDEGGGAGGGNGSDGGGGSGGDGPGNGDADRPDEQASGAAAA